MAVSVEAAPKWSKLQTEDVVIYSDAPEKDIVEFSTGYAAFRHVFRELFQPAKRPPPATVVLFRRLSTLQDYAKKSKHKEVETVAYTTQVDGEALVAVAVDGNRFEALRRVYEFDTIWQLEYAGYFLPLWMAQGAGEVLSSLQLKHNVCVVGDGPGELDDKWTHDVPLPWERFFFVSRESAEYSGEDADGLYHAQAWALMHRILLNDADSAKTFKQLAAHLRDMDAQKAVETTLELGGKGDITTSISAHFRKRETTRQFIFDAASFRASLRVLPAPESEVHIQLANLLFSSGAKDKGAADLARAQSLSPNAAIVKEALARRALLDRDPDRAARFYREAIEAGSVNSMAYLFSATQRLNDNSGGADRAGDGGPDVEKAIGEIRKTLRLNPGSAEAYRLLGRAFFVTPKISDKHIQELSQGVAAGEGGVGARYYRALLYARLDRHDEFQADLERIIADPEVSPRLRGTAEEQLENHRFQRVAGEVSRLVNAKKCGEAADRLAKARAAAGPNAPTEQYEKLARWIAESAALSRIDELRDGKKWAECETAIEEFLEKYPRSQAVPALRAFAERLPTRSRK